MRIISQTYLRGYTMKTDEAYVRAAKIISSCPKSRLPAVIALLEKSGLEIGELEKQTLLVKQPDHRFVLKSKRTDTPKPRWLSTNNECILKLREAYNDGISMTELARTLELGRSSVFRYLYAEVIPNDIMQEKILEAISKNSKADM